MRTGNWDQDEIALLRREATKRTSRIEMAQMLNRPISGLRSKMNELGITLPIKSGWSDAKERKLKRLIASKKYSTREMAEMMGTTRGSVQHHRRKYLAPPSEAINTDWYIKHGFIHATPAKSVGAQCRLSVLAVLKRAEQLDLGRWPAPAR